MKIIIARLILMIYPLTNMAQSINIKYEYCIDLFCLLDTSYIMKTNGINHQYNSNKDIEIVLINKIDSSYLIMTHYPGDDIGKMSLFEVGYLINMDKTIVSSYNETNSTLSTNNNTALGVPMDNIIALQELPDSISVQNNYTVFHYIEDDPESIILQKYNEYIYFIEYWFMDNKLSRMIFGFEYP